MHASLSVLWCCSEKEKKINIFDIFDIFDKSGSPMNKMPGVGACKLLC